MTRPQTQPRCCECRKVIRFGEPSVERRGPAGNTMTLIHREVVNRWHPACWDAATARVEKSRAEYEERVRAEVRALAEANGLPDPYATEAAQ